jgi:hypothetical protein
MPINQFFNRLFTADEQEQIRSFNKKEPLMTARRAFVLFAYMSDYPIYDIQQCVNRNFRQTRYLIDKAAELYSVRDREITRIIEKYETTLGQPDKPDTNID